MAFAESINPVFGKLGQRVLGKTELADFAEKFGFNQNPNTDFEFPAPTFQQPAAITIWRNLDADLIGTP